MRPDWQSNSLIIYTVQVWLILHFVWKTMILMMASFWVVDMVELPSVGLKILKLHLFQIVMAI